MLLALVTDISDARRIRKAVDSIMPSVWCQSAIELLDAAPHAQLVLTEPLDATGAPVAEAIANLRRRTPHLPIIAYTALTPESVRALGVLAAHGVHSVIIRGVDDSQVNLRRAVDDAVVHTCEAHLWESVMPLIPAAVHGIVRYCIEHSGQPISVSDIRRSVGLPERTLNAQLRRAGLPSAQEIISWCRLVRVACLLHNPSLTLEVVAGQMGFSTPSAVNALVMRLTGTTPSSLRRAGAITRTVAALRSRFTPAA